MGKLKYSPAYKTMVLPDLVLELPTEVCDRAGFRIGDVLRIECVGEGMLELHKHTSQDVTDDEISDSVDLGRLLKCHVR